MARLVGFLLLTAALAAEPLPTPEQFAGFRMGADRKLVRWEQIARYLRLAAEASPRVRVDEAGRTTNGHPFLLVTISAAGNLGRLPQHREWQRRFAYPYELGEEEAAAIAARHKAILLITCNIHSTEIGSSQMALELVYRLATEESAFVRNILENVILLLVPSANPDGQILVTDWYRRNVGTPYEHSPLPELYHKYAGHDNNRDAFMNTQVESRILNRITYREWLPHVVLDEHQMGNAGARMFVPPFTNPINPNVDPVVWQLNGLLGYAMGAALHERNHTGIINDALYTSWWQGGFVMQAWWHNMAGLLTEVASAAVASPVEQERAAPGERQTPLTREQLEAVDPRKPLPAPRDTLARNTYPRPWLGGRWTLRDVIDYELTATYGLLEAAANQRALLIRAFYRMNRRQIELGKRGGPFAWVVPKDQHDPPVAARLLQILDELGVEVYRAAEEFPAGGLRFPGGSHVIPMAQPFRAFAKDLLERQVYPAPVRPGVAAERPYDVTGWTLPLQMGVEAVEIRDPFEARLEKISPVPLPAGEFVPAQNAVAWEIAHTRNNAYVAANRLLAKPGVRLAWADGGGIVARSRADLTPLLKEMSGALGIQVRALSALPAGLRPLRSPRLALYRPALPSMDEGWTRWLLEQYEFPYHSAGPAEVKAGGLRQRFDAVLIADIPKDRLLEGHNHEWMRSELRGGLGSEGVNALKEFVRDGGVLITLGASSLAPVEEFPLPLKNALKGLRPEQFSCPGAILRVFVDNRHPVGFGMRERAPAVFYQDVAFEPLAPLGEAEVRVLARYPAGGLLESGWLHGAEFLHDKIAAAEVTYGAGRVIALGFSVQNRAQPHGTFKLLFNAIHYAGLGADE